ncbi:MAG: hypothetical protein SGJ27_02150 [Candidatus Melainabacteria bacterium]|nr:hypothetical protein [Candidatus Melainabacteria bacterium]
MTAEKANEKDRFTRLQEKLAMLPRCTPEEREAFAAEREASKGTMNESAMMLDNGEIAVKTWCHGHDGVIGDGWLQFLPTDDDYEKAKQEYGLNKPGDNYYVIKKWVDGEWVVQEEKRPDKPETGKAKSA